MEYLMETVKFLCKGSQFNKRNTRYESGIFYKISDAISLSESKKAKKNLLISIGFFTFAPLLKFQKTDLKRIKNLQLAKSHPKI